jgi:glycosyltransferase involved in cell wall biosynthesis
MPPRVSVVVPAYNAERFLEDCLRSVQAQSFGDFECIVVNDGSTDGTAAVAAAIDDARFRVLTKENRGTVSDARNAGLGAASGDLVAFLDADDVWLPDKLARQVELLDTNPDIGLVYCGYAIADEDLTPATILWPDDSDPRFERWLLLEGNGIAPSSTTLLRRAALDLAGQFRLELSVSEDVDLAERAARVTGVGYIDDCLVLYRTHPGQGHHKIERFEHDMSWIFDDRFGPQGTRDRRRWRRGRANLHTRLAYFGVLHGDFPEVRRNVRLALSYGASRLVLLPAEAVIRRTRRSIRMRRRRADVVAVATFAAGIRAS